MGSSLPSTLAAAVLIGTTGSAAGQELPAPDGIELAADGLTYYGDSSRVDFQGLHLRQGDIQIEAGAASASALDYDNSEWRLSGVVRITIGSAAVTSEEARFTFTDAQLTMLELRGHPATFEDLDSAQPKAATGGADRIYYDGTAQALSLTGNAWLSVGEYDIMGCDLIYDLDQNTFQSGSSECDEPVRIRSALPAEDSAAGERPESP